MSIVLDLTPNEESSLSSLALRGGVAPAEMAAQLIRQGLDQQGLEQGLEPQGLVPQTDASRNRVLAKLHQWQKETGTVTAPRVSSRELFRRWAQEDAQMTEAEQQHETQLWEGIEKGVHQNRLTIGEQP